MKILQVKQRGQIMVRYEDDYGVAAFVLSADQSKQLAQALTEAVRHASIHSDYSVTVFAEKGADDDQV